MDINQQKVSIVSTRTYLRLLGRYLRPQWKKVVLMALLLFLGIALQLVVPQILRFFIDTATQGGATELLFRAAFIYLAAAVANQILGAGATYFGADVGWTATNFMRRDLAEHCLNLDMGFHTARNSGEMIERIDGDVTALSDFFSQFTVRLLGAALLLLGILIFLWLETPLAGAALTLFTVLVMAFLVRTRELAVPATALEREASAQHFGFIEERLSGIEDIRANGGGAHAMQRFVYSMRQFYKDTRRAWLTRSFIWLSSFGLFLVGDVLTLAVATYLVLQGSITIGAAYLVFQYMLMLRAPVEQIARQLQELQKAAASISRIGALFETQSSLATPKGLVLPVGAQAISFERVSFSYDDKAVLKDVSFQLKAGQKLGLLGRTGSGKTTITRLLFRFYDPTSGTVRLNGVDLKDASQQDLHTRVGMVTQEVQLFHASVRDNLSFFDTSISDEQILVVLDDLGLLPWLATLKNGLDTILDAGNAGLSAGEGQLLAFARAFLKDPGLVILDEPSSRLDPATEKQLERAMTKLLEGRTAIIIAHRLATVERVDEIMIIEDGCVLEHDARAVLAADEASRFSHLLKAGSIDLDAGLGGAA